MKKIVVSILALLVLPISAGATADALTFAQDTNITVGSVTLVVRAGSLVDDMVVNSSNVVFTLSANSILVIRSNDRFEISNDSGIEFICSSSYSEMSISGTTYGTSVIVYASSVVCGISSSSGTPVISSGGGGGGSATPTPSTPSVPTTTTGEVTATASGGGKTTLTTGESTTAAVELPVNAVSASTDVKIEHKSKGPITASRPTPSSRTIVGSYVYDYTAISNGSSVSSFDQTVTLTFTYTDSQIAGLEESTLRVFYWKESTSQWVALPTTVNASSNSLVAETDHFTYFAIMAVTEGEEESRVAEETPSAEVVEGDLIRNPNAEGMAQFDIYIVKLINGKKFKRLILSPHVFESYEHFDKNGNGSPWDDVLDVNQLTMDEYTDSDLIRVVGGTKVYQLIPSGDTGVKQWLNITGEQFISQGYDGDSIYEINATDRDAYTTGADIVL
ncbi:MAG: hypothetical protein ABII95_02415 [Patescibacteria group bacterium]|nr:hypothetical protein [Nanoarchaeota archaeon]